MRVEMDFDGLPWRLPREPLLHTDGEDASRRRHAEPGDFMLKSQ